MLLGLGQPFFRFSPRILFDWRSFLLRLFGAKICKYVHIYNSTIIYIPRNFKIGYWSSIEDNAWDRADNFVKPCVTIGEGAVVGACAVVVKNVEPWSVVAANPATLIKKRVIGK